MLREYPAQEYEIRSHPKPKYDDWLVNCEGKVGLLVERIANRLDQPIAYKVLINGKKISCQAKTAHKYFRHTKKCERNEGTLDEKKNLKK